MIFKYLVVFEIFSVICAIFTNFNSLYSQLEQLIEESKLYQSPVNNNGYWAPTGPVFDEKINFGTFDFIIIGGGTAGGVLANRLTEENFTVLVIEAGGKSPDVSAVLGVNSRPWNVAYNAEVINFFSFNNNSSLPDMEFLIPGLSSTTGNVSTGNIFMSLLNPLSVGEISLTSKSPKDFPLINPNYLANESDVEALYNGIQKGLELLNTTFFQKYHANVSLPAIEECDKKNILLSKDWWICQLRYSASTFFHPTGSTRMGHSSNISVVDSELKVHGIKKLRIVDAGEIPPPTTGHTNAPTVMIAEKIADIIKNNYS